MILTAVVNNNIIESVASSNNLNNIILASILAGAVGVVTFVAIIMAYRKMRTVPKPEV